MLAQPFHFAPRSTLRLQVTERTEGVRGTLFVVLYGYRLLGAASCPEPVVRQLRGAPQCPVETIGNPDARVIPFDYVAVARAHRTPRQPDRGRAGGQRGGWIRRHQHRLRTRRRESGREAATRSRSRSINGNKPWTSAHLPLRLFPASALQDGIRLRPDWLRLALRDNGALADALPVDVARQPVRAPQPSRRTSRFAMRSSTPAPAASCRTSGSFNVAGLGHRRRRPSLQEAGAADDLPAALDDSHRARGSVWTRQGVHRLPGLQAARVAQRVPCMMPARQPWQPMPRRVAAYDEPAARTMPFDYTLPLRPRRASPEMTLRQKRDGRASRPRSPPCRSATASCPRLRRVIFGPQPPRSIGRGAWHMLGPARAARDASPRASAALLTLGGESSRGRPASPCGTSPWAICWMRSQPRSQRTGCCPRACRRSRRRCATASSSIRTSRAWRSPAMATRCWTPSIAARSCSRS